MFKKKKDKTKQGPLFKTSLHLEDNQKIQAIFRNGIKTSLPKVVFTSKKVEKLKDKKKEDLEEIYLNLDNTSKTTNMIERILDNYNKISNITEHRKKVFHPTAIHKYRTKVTPIDTVKVKEKTIVERIVEDFDSVKEYSKQMKDNNIQNFERNINIDFSSIETIIIDKINLMNTKDLKDKYKMYEDTLHPEKDLHLNKVERKTTEKKFILKKEIRDLVEKQEHIAGKFSFTKKLNYQKCLDGKR
jgi:hypothetical protein